MDDYLSDFVQESEEGITELNNALLDLEDDPDDEEAIDQIFRTAHTLKGNCGAMGFTDASQLAHVLEEVLEAVRAEQLEVTSDLMDVIFEGVDCFDTMIDEVREEGEPQTDPADAIESIEDVLDEVGDEELRSAGTLGPPTEDEIDEALTDIGRPTDPTSNLYHVRLEVTEDRDVVGLDGMLVLEALADAFDVLGTTPAPEVIQNGEYEESFDAIISSAIGVGDITAALEDVEQVDEVVVTDVTGWIDWGGIDAEPRDGTDDVDVDDLGIDQLLEEFEEFDDIDGIDPSQVADIELDDDLGESGTFEDVSVGSPEVGLDEEFLDDDDDDIDPSLDPEAPVEPQPQDASSTFKELQNEVDQVEYDELQEDLEELEFEELQDEEEVSFDALVEGDFEFDDDGEPDETIEEFGELVGDDEEEDVDDEFDDLMREVEADDFDDDFDDDFGDLLEESPPDPDDVEEEGDAIEEDPDAAEVSTDEDIDFEEVIGGDVDLDGVESTIDDIQSVRVDVEQLDQLYNLVEELVTSRIRLRRSLEERDEDLQQAFAELDELETVTGRVQNTVMDIRLVPLEQVTTRLPRIVRDIARDQDKLVSFELDGQDAELDRAILDEIGDPLVHLVRNAVDHGIESPDERGEADKPREGTIRLTARQVRDRVTIEITDDGRGLDAKELRETAVQQGLVSPDEAARMDDQDAYELIFHPGFSTTEEVTDVSGRGVGMDVVRNTVTSLDGTVEVESDPGEGTTVRLRLPISIATVRVLFVQSGDERYGIPLKSVDEITRVSDLTTVEGEEVHTHDDTVYPLIRLGETLDVPGPTRNGDGRLIRISDEVRQVALHCDGVIRQEEVVIKPFSGILSDIPGLSGATVLGEGDVVNILDVESL